MKEVYINPEGNIVKLKGNPKDWISIHAGIAAEVLGTEDGDAMDRLHNLGWMVWGSQCTGYRLKGRPTQAQINTIDKMGHPEIVQKLLKLLQ